MSSWFHRRADGRPSHIAGIASLSTLLAVVGYAPAHDPPRVDMLAKGEIH